MLFFKPAEEVQADLSCLPRHIAIIMDGNGRWARKRGLPRTAGHAAGAETFRTIATYCKEIGLEYLTVSAFSTENWKRPAEEVGAIMGLLKKYLLEAIGQMERDRVKMEFFGDLSPLPQELRDLCQRTREISTHYEGCQVNICLNYGGRDELLRAARAYAQECLEGAGPGSHHPAQRRAAAVQFPAVAVRLFGILFHRRAVARLLQGGAPPGHRGLSEPQPPIWRCMIWSHGSLYQWCWPRSFL